jgi:exopolysaccharide biosynthesis predicted pyruvyltransferase EpsI
VKDTLFASLASIGSPGRCALLHYPNHVNIGDHLIWCGTVRYLDQIAGASLAYIADADSFSVEAMNQALGPGGRVFLHGGGNLGDIWPERQRFTEQVITACRNRAIVIFPQTVFFQDPAAARRAAGVFHSHPDLTIFARDRRSFAVASEVFPRCKVALAPDMAFALEGCFDAPSQRPPRALYLARKDKETSGVSRALPSGFERQDWISLDRRWRWDGHPVPFPRRQVRIFRQWLQRDFLSPRLSRQRELWLEGPGARLWSQERMNHHWHRLSLALIHDGMRQLQDFGFVVSDRLHAHIFCLLLGIPHVLLPNLYFKNQAFHETWTHASPLCRFSTPEDLPLSWIEQERSRPL